MIEWLSPLWFLALIPLILLIVFLFYKRHARTPTLQYSYVTVFKGVPRGFRSYLSECSFILKILVMILIIVALARPRTSQTHVSQSVDGIDLVIALDISDSMLIEDMEPHSRLESAKRIIKEFVQNRISDRMGLVLFSGEAFTRVPLTLDYAVFLERLKSVQTIASIKMGTAIGVALANSVGRLKDSKAQSRVIILLTDGENNSGTIDPETALEMAKGYNLRIYTIGVGKDGMAQIPIYYQDMFGNKRKAYQSIHSQVNDTLLTRLATQTGGKYFRATYHKALEEIFSEINVLEKSKIETQKFMLYQEKFQFYIQWALILLGVSLLLRHIFIRVGP